MVRPRGSARLAVAGLAAAILVAACGSNSKPSSQASTTVGTSGSNSSSTAQGVTPTTITLGQIADISGPIPGLMQGTSFGIDAWAAEVNSEGGIDGRKIVIDHKDSALSCTAYTNGITSLLKSTFAIVGSASAVDSCGATVVKANPAVPVIPAFFVSTNWSFSNVIPPIPQPPGWSTTSFLWIKAKFGAAAVQKYADLYSTGTQMGFDENTAAAEAVGYKLVYSRGIGYTETNFTSDILRMKAEGVQVVNLIDDAVNQVASFEDQAAQQDFHPDAVISYAYDHNLFKEVGNPADVNNLYLPNTSVLYLGEDAGTVPEIGTMTSWLQKTHPGAPVSLYVFEGWISGLLFQQAMASSGKTPSQARLLTALTNTKSFSADGLLPPGNVGEKIPNNCVVMTGVRDGKFVRLDPAKTGFLCNGSFVPYTS